MIAPRGCLWPTSYYTSCGAASIRGRLCGYHLSQVLERRVGGDVPGPAANVCHRQAEVSARFTPRWPWGRNRADGRLGESIVGGKS